jgi:hypothetical protein
VESRAMLDLLKKNPKLDHHDLFMHGFLKIAAGM